MASRALSEGKTVTYTRKLMEGASLLGIAFCLMLVPMTSSFWISLIIFTMAMAARGLHHGGVSVNPHDFAPNHAGSVFGKGRLLLNMSTKVFSDCQKYQTLHF